MEKFRPQALPKNFVFLFRLRGKHTKLDWVNRRIQPTSTLGRIGSHLHYLGSHSPMPVLNKWRKAERRFLKRYQPILWKMIELGIKKERF